MKNLLGSIQKTTLLKNAAPALNQQLLTKPLEWPEAVCRCWCRQCGTLKEISRLNATKLQKIAGEKITGDIKDFYFIVSYCEYCEERELTIEIKSL